MMLVQILMGSSIVAKETGEYGSLPRCVTASKSVRLVGVEEGVKGG